MNANRGIGAAGAAASHTNPSRIGFMSLVEREIVRVLKIWSQTIAAPVLTAMLYLGVFGVSLGQRIGQVHGVDYLTYIVPGVVLMQVAMQAYANNSSSTFQARSDGYIEDVLSAPMHAWQVALALLAGGALRALVVGALVLGAAALMTDIHVAHPLQLVVLMVVVSVLWGSIGTIAGVFAQTFDQHMLIGNLIIMPLVFVGGVFYSVEMLPEGLAWLTRMDPLFYQVQGMRHAMLGASDASFALATGMTVALAGACFALQVALFMTGYRLKD